MGLIKHITRLWSDRRGGVGKLFGLTLPLVLLAGGPILELTEQTWVNARLQSLADGAALAAAHELSMTKTDSAHIQKTVSAYVEARRQKAGATGAVDVQANVSAGLTGVTVVVSREWATSFSQVIGLEKTSTYALATAQVVGNTKICALGLMDGEDEPGVQLDDHAQLSAPDCGVYSNSKSASSIEAAQSAKLAAHLICAAGGTSVGHATTLSPDPMTDCTQIRDPLAHRAAPAVASCLETNLVIENSTVLFPGTYCGGLTIKKNAWVGLQPGVYVIKDGPLLVKDEAELDGKHVSFHMVGEDAVFSFAKDTKIKLGAPKAGALAGLLFYEAPSVQSRVESAPVQSSLMAVLNIPARKKQRVDPVARTHRISSSGARQLLGTIYLPRSSLQIDAEGPVADKSAYTAIVARNLNLLKGPHLVLNTDYWATDVPVPRAIAGGDIRLTE